MNRDVPRQSGGDPSSLGRARDLPRRAQRGRTRPAEPQNRDKTEGPPKPTIFVPPCCPLPPPSTISVSMNDLMFTHGDSGAASTRVGGKSKASQASTAQSRAGASAAGGDKATPSTSSRTHGDHDDDGAADVSESSESESDDEPPLPPHVIVTSEMLAESEEKNAKSLQQIVDDRVVALRETDKLDPSEVVVVVTPEMQHTAKKYAKGKHTGRYKRRGEGQTWKQLEQDETDYLIQDQLESLIKEEVWRLRLEAWRLREDEALKAELAARDAAGMLLLLLGVCSVCVATETVIC
jgi:hypothetical protein